MKAFNSMGYIYNLQFTCGECLSYNLSIHKVFHLCLCVNVPAIIVSKSDSVTEVYLW
jgi:hypothetical protein